MTLTYYCNCLGISALKVGKGPKHFRPRQGGIHGNPMSGNLSCRELQNGTVTLKLDQGKITHLTPILSKRGLNF